MKDCLGILSAKDLEVLVLMDEKDIRPLATDAENSLEDNIANFNPLMLKRYLKSFVLGVELWRAR